MYNRTSATLMLQTIMVLMDKQNSTDVTNFPGSYTVDFELERCYGIYGCFSKAYPWTEHRPDNYFPMTPESMGVIFPTFTRRNRKIPVMLHANSTDKIKNANLNPRGPFYFISHGFIDDGHKPWIQNMVNALLDLEGNVDATVVIVDWRGGSQPPYGQAVANIRLVGAMTANLIHNIHDILGLPNLDNFHYIGHSLGAHLGGYCGHELQKKFNLKLGRITGLDPAAPYFSKTVTLVRLDRSDAKYVDIIHSNAMPLYFSGFGISEPIGHVDFYPNGGSTQPGCKAVDSPAGASYQQVVKFVGCNHQRSHEYFQESISPSCPFLAIQCESYDGMFLFNDRASHWTGHSGMRRDLAYPELLQLLHSLLPAFLAGNCTNCDNRHFCIPMGYHSYSIYKRLQLGGLADSNSNIALYSSTGSSRPYCRVHYEVVLKVSNSTESRNHGPESGKLLITLVDRNNNRSDTRFLNDEQKYYKPGEIETKMIALKDTGHPPIFVIVEWKYEANLFNPMTWRLLKSPSIYVEYIKLSSIEYNTDITVCPKLNKPVVANLPTIMKTKYCKFTK